MKLEVREYTKVGTEFFTEGDIVTVKFNEFGVSEYGITELNGVEIQVINEQNIYLNGSGYYSWYDIEAIEKYK